MGYLAKISQWTKKWLLKIPMEVYNLNLDRSNEAKEGKNIVLMNALSDAMQSTDLLRSFKHSVNS